MKIETFKYVGRTYKNCDPSGAQQAILQQLQSWSKMLTNSYSSVFGDGSQMFQQLSQSLNGIISKGPDTMGYSPEELAAKNSQAINSAAASAKDVNQAIGTNAAKGGAVPGVESGVVQSERAQADTSVLNNLSNKEADITEKGYDVGRQEFNTAVQEKENSLGASFNPSTSMAGAVTGADSATAAQANANAAESTSWMGLVGGMADAAVGGMSPFGKKGGSGGGGSSTQSGAGSDVEYS